MEELLMDTVKIDDWAIVGDFSDPYQPPEQRMLKLRGKIFGHSRHKDGEYVLTSVIMHAEGREVFTKNTKYILETVNPTYKKWYAQEVGKELNENSPF